MQKLSEYLTIFFAFVILFAVMMALANAQRTYLFEYSVGDTAHANVNGCHTREEAARILNMGVQDFGKSLKMLRESKICGGGNLSFKILELDPRIWHMVGETYDVTYQLFRVEVLTKLPPEIPNQLWLFSQEVKIIPRQEKASGQII